MWSLRILILVFDEHFISSITLDIVKKQNKSYVALHATFITVFSRYVESSKAVIGKADKSKLQPVALSCMLNIGACKLKMSNWQGAIDSCLEVSLFDV